MTNTNRENVQDATVKTSPVVEGMENVLEYIDEAEISNAGGPKMKVTVKKDMKKYVKPVVIFGAGAVTCYACMKIIPMVMATKATEAVVDTAVDAALATAADTAISTAALTAATAMI